ncbi:MAG TPA: aspartyl protease family protein [Puia sp.]|jgi:clan AA aspartic protease
MGLIYAELELINGEDIILARRHIIGEEEIKRIHVNVLVDTGSMYMCINENVRELLQVPTIAKRKGQLANGEIVECDVVGPIEVRFKNRLCHVDAMVLPGGNELLLGAIPMEDLDVIIHPSRQELDVNPESPDMAMMKLKKCLPMKRAA